jgi:hypothetical protein
MKSLLRLQRRVAGRTNAVGQDAMVAVIPANPTAPVILTDLAGDDIHTDNTNYSYVRPHVFSTDRLFPLVADVGVVRELVGSTTPDGFDCIQMREVPPLEAGLGHTGPTVRSVVSRCQPN